MATTRKNVVPAKEKIGKPAPNPLQSPKTRPTRPSPGSSEKDCPSTSTRKTATANYLKPTISSSPTASSSQKSLPEKKSSTSSRPQSLRSPSNPSRQGKTVISSKEKVKDKEKKSAPSSVNLGENKEVKEERKVWGKEESALDILNADEEEPVLVEIPPVEEKIAGMEEVPKMEDEEEEEEKKKDDEEESKEKREEIDNEEESVKDLMASAEGGDEESEEKKEEVAPPQAEKELEVPPKEKKEVAAAPPQGKKEAPPVYNNVIEETVNKLAEKRRNKVLALVGAFETVISLDSGGPA